MATDIGQAILVVMFSLIGVVGLIVILAKVIRPRNGNGSSPTSQGALAETIRRFEARQVTIEQQLTRIENQLRERREGAWQRSQPSKS